MRVRGPDKKPRKVRTDYKTKHGHTGRGARSIEYSTWARMIQRCTNPRAADYPRYGARGITVHPEWVRDFSAFYHHIGPRPSDKHSIDRIDGSKGYEPGNVRWATITEQNQNRRNVRRIFYNGKNLTLKEYCAEVGISAGTIDYRMYVLKWSFHDAINPRDGRQSPAKRNIPYPV